MAAPLSQNSSKRLIQKEAAELLDWLIGFLPGTIPASAEEAIIEVCDDVHALFWHRSELHGILEKHPEALNHVQKQKLAKLDHDIKAAGLLLFGASKGTLRRYREGRYDRSHWWWYIDNLVREANLVCNKTKKRVEYAVPEETGVLLKVAEPRAEYKRKSRSEKK
jgi:hypothetical protein